MRKKYRHLSLEEREKISILKAQGYSCKDIGKAIGRDKSTISRELSVNSPPCYKGYYLGHKADQRARKRRQSTHRRPRLKNKSLRRYIVTKLRLGWSPEQISGHIERNPAQPKISHEAIYQYIYQEARELIVFLPRHHRKRFPRGHTRKHRQAHILGKISIEQRPAHIEKRKQLGHWERDGVVSRLSKESLNVLAERKTKLVKISKVPRNAALEVRRTTNRRLSKLPCAARRTITYDNGSENADHLKINECLGLRSFFCNPFHSWEKGTVENTVGLIRRFLPKKTDFAKVSSGRIRRIENLLNNRPRKCLGFRTPLEVFNKDLRCN